MDWSSDVCSSDLDACLRAAGVPDVACVRAIAVTFSLPFKGRAGVGMGFPSAPGMPDHAPIDPDHPHAERQTHPHPTLPLKGRAKAEDIAMKTTLRSEEHTSELQSLMRISYAVFCLK